MSMNPITDLIFKRLHLQCMIGEKTRTGGLGSFQWYHIHLNLCNIDRDVIITWIITGFGKSVHRAVWKGLLALSGTSYKWLSHRGVHLSSGPIIQFPSFAQDSQISYRLQLVWPISPLLLYGFQSNLVSMERYFRGESNAVCYEGQGLLFMENVGNYRNCATRIIPEILVVIKSGLLLSGRLPFCPGRSPSVWHRFG